MVTMTSRTPKADSLHSRVVDVLGMAIISGELARHTTLTIDDLESRYGVSRSVMRETLRVLESKGMIRSRRRVGIQVQPQLQWSLFDPTIIRWRLKSEEMMTGQLRELMELRLAIEPLAGRLAAERATLAETSELLAITGQLWEAGHSTDMDAFIEADIAFHHVLLTASGNEMFAQLNLLLGEQLRGRAAQGLMPPEHSPIGLQFHMDVAGCVQRRDADGTHDALYGIIKLAIHEMDTLWTLHGKRLPVDGVIG